MPAGCLCCQLAATHGPHWCTAQPGISQHSMARHGAAWRSTCDRHVDLEAHEHQVYCKPQRHLRGRGVEGQQKAAGWAILFGANFKDRRDATLLLRLDSMLGRQGEGRPGRINGVTGALRLGSSSPDQYLSASSTLLLAAAGYARIGLTSALRLESRSRFTRCSVLRMRSCRICSRLRDESTWGGGGGWGGGDN